MSISTAAVCSSSLLASVRSSLDIFSGLTDEAWSAAAATLRTEFHRNGDQIAAKGDPAEALFIVWEGQVNISADGTHLLTRGKHDIVGEQALINDIGLGATMTASGDVQLILVPAATYQSLVGPNSFARGLLKVLSAKLNEATAQRARRFALEERLFAEFRAHVSPAVLNALLSGDEDYARPRCIEAVVLLSDIRGFSTRASGLEPIQVAEQVGQYLNHAVDTVHQHGGLVDKFIGDAILAVWGWPLDRGDEDVCDAFRCAKALVETAGRFSFGGQPVEIGVGLNAGAMFIGNVGSEEKRQFTVLGEAVNLAARLEAMCKELRASIVVSESVHKRLPVDATEHLTAHHNQQPKGGAAQTVYSTEPRATVSARQER
jgi:class 3 adenylate cyclase